VLDRSILGDRPPDSDFEEDVGMALARLGYEVVHQVGVAGFWVDLAVKDKKRPGSYLLGIECDGASYHSSRSARDRDRIRELVLRDRGWRIHRVWSTNWFKSRNQELQRLVAAITAAGERQEAAPSAGPVALDERGTNERIPKRPLPSESASREPPRRAYVEANFTEVISVEPHELPLLQRADIVTRIVEVEGPIHHEEVARRFATVCGKQRAGGRIGQAVEDALKSAVRQGRLRQAGSFYSANLITSCDPRDRSSARSITVRNPAMLPPIEIRTAILNVVGDHVGVAPDVAVVAATRLFGFQRTGAGLNQVFEEQVRALLGDDVLQLKNTNKLYLRDAIV
jgi:very-short-patch-repair endonuclease